MQRLIPLHVLQPGQVAEVSNVVGQPDLVRRLEELGLRGGALIEVVRSGSPCIVRLGGSTLCLRNGELLSVIVAPRKSA